MGYVTTPDGRTIFAPDAFGGGPTPFDSDLGGAPAMPPQPDVAPAAIAPTSALDQQASALPDGPQLAPVPTPAPQQLKPDFEAPLPAPPTPAQQKATAQQAAYDASPAGLQAKADAEYQTAQAQKQEAINQSLAAETGKNDEILAARREADDKAKEIEAKKTAYQAQYDQTREQKQTQLEALQQQANDVKITDGGYSGGQRIGMLIAAAISGIGNALAGKGGDANPVLQMMKDHADQSIRLQMDQRDQLQRKAGQAEHMLDRFDSFSHDKIAQFDAARSVAYNNLANQIETAGAKAANPIAKANASQAAAQLRAEGAAHGQSAADRATAHEVQQQQLGLQKQANAIAGGHLALAKDQFEWQRTKDQEQLDLEAAKLEQAGNKKAADDYQKFGVPGAKMVDKDGKSVPMTAIGSDSEVGKVREKMAATKTMVGILDQALRLRTGYSSSVTDREEWQKARMPSASELSAATISNSSKAISAPLTQRPFAIPPPALHKLARRFSATRRTPSIRTSPTATRLSSTSRTSSRRPRLHRTWSVTSRG
jgi:hypothetical protein